MGSAKLDLRTIEMNRPQELVIKLEDQSRPFRSLGELKINITLWPKTQEDKEQVNNRVRNEENVLWQIHTTDLFLLFIHTVFPTTSTACRCI